MFQFLEDRELRRNADMRRLLALTGDYRPSKEDKAYPKWLEVRNRLQRSIHESEGVIADLRAEEDNFGRIDEVEEKKTEFEDRWGEDGLGDLRHAAYQAQIPFEEYL